MSGPDAAREKPAEPHMSLAAAGTQSGFFLLPGYRRLPSHDELASLGFVPPLDADRRVSLGGPIPVACPMFTSSTCG